MPVRSRSLPGCGDGNGLDAHRRSGALPGMVFLVAPAEDRTNPGPPAPVALTDNARTRHAARSAADDSRSSGSCGICKERLIIGAGRSPAGAHVALRQGNRALGAISGNSAPVLPFTSLRNGACSPANRLPVCPAAGRLSGRHSTGVRGRSQDLAAGAIAVLHGCLTETPGTAAVHGGAIRARPTRRALLG
jgi:hypothetical protein